MPELGDVKQSRRIFRQNLYYGSLLLKGVPYSGDRL